MTYPRTDDRIGLYGAKREEKRPLDWIQCRGCREWFQPSEPDEKRCEVCERDGEGDSD